MLSGESHNSIYRLKTVTVVQSLQEDFILWTLAS